MPNVAIIRRPLSREEMRQHCLEGTLVKAVVDCKQGIMAIGGQLHADEEQVLLEAGSRQEDLWGINLYPDNATDQWIEFDSMINIRPSQGNRSRNVDDPKVRQRIRDIVASLVLP